MKKRSPSGCTWQTKKESSPYTESGQPFAQDTNPPVLPAVKTSQDSVNYIFSRAPPCEHQDDDSDRLTPQDSFNNSGDGNCQKEELLVLLNNPLTPTTETGHPVVQKEPNKEEVESHYLRQVSASSGDSSGISSFVDQDLELSRRLSQLSTSQYRNCGTCGLLMKKFYCDDSKQFWKEIENVGPDRSQGCHIKFFEKFLEKLREKFPSDYGLGSKNTINLLKTLLKVDHKDKTAGVRLADLHRVVELFGPIKLQENKCVLISQLHQLIQRSLKARDKDKKVKSSWFVGEMTRGEAENALLDIDCKDKTFLIRISGTDGSGSDFVLSVKHEDHCHHIKIQGNSSKAVKLEESHYHQHLYFAGQEFSSLPDVVDYITKFNVVKIEQDDGDEAEENTCSSVTCLRVFSKSPLNGAMSGYEKSKR